MKTAVSIPDEVFDQVERLARRGRRSRSEVYSAALREYVARHAPDEVTEAMNRVCDAVGTDRDEFLRAAGRQVWSARSGDLSGRGVVGRPRVQRSNSAGHLVWSAVSAEKVVHEVPETEEADDRAGDAD